MLNGKIISLTADKGFGFIAAADGGEDLFFHRSTVEGGFDSLHVGEEVCYERDPTAPKPRAKKVTRSGFAAAGSSGSAAGAHRGDYPQNIFAQAELGFVTKLWKTQRLGFISADCGGPELLFGKENVSGMRQFSELLIGDSVRFVRGAETDEVGPPLATAVQFIERRQKKSGLELPSNPSAQRKKPTWRR